MNDRIEELLSMLVAYQVTKYAVEIAQIDARAKGLPFMIASDSHRQEAIERLQTVAMKVRSALATPPA